MSTPTGFARTAEFARATDVRPHYGAGLAFVARYGDGSEMLRDRSAPDIPSQPDGFAVPSSGMNNGGSSPV